MQMVSIVVGMISILLGVGLSVASRPETRFGTPLIPAYVGIIYVLIGALSNTPTRRKHLMHLGAALALLLVLGGLGMGLPKLLKYYTGTLPADAGVRPLAWWGQVALAAIMAVFLVFAIRSFKAARRARLSGAAVA